MWPDCKRMPHSLAVRRWRGRQAENARSFHDRYLTRSRIVTAVVDEVAVFIY